VHQAASPLDFVRVDAEVVDRNVIRLDTDNVLDIVLTPGAALIDSSKPVRVIWNGVVREMRVTGGALRLTSSAYKPARLHKTPDLPGSSSDFLMTPFAIVVGTSSKDPDMVALCKAKAQGFVEAWRDWQKVDPRVFLDSEINETDLRRYSLMLVGGPDANRVSARFAASLPLRISAGAVRIDGKEFEAKDAAVQMVYPHPLNASRYVWMFAGTSTDGMYFTEPSPLRVYDWDYTITDGRIPAFKQSASARQTRVVSGSFDYNWRYSAALNFAGDADVRAKGRLLRRPDKNLKIDPQVLASYAGRYQIGGGPVAEVYMEGGKLKSRVNAQVNELVPESETTFYLPLVNVRVFFERDGTGKVTGFKGWDGEDFEGRKLE
jgi:hypothetical protein